MRAEVASAGELAAAVAARQHGMVTRVQLRSAGIPEATITRWARAGRLHRVHRGVFALGVRRSDPDARWAAAVLAAGRGAFLSHRSSAEAQRIVLIDELTHDRSSIHVSRPGHSARRDGIVIHSAQVDPVDVTRVGGVPATTAARTLFDLCRHVGPSALRRAFEEAEFRGILDRHRLRVLCASNPGHRGIAGLRELLGAEPIPASELRSRLEALLFRVCRENGLPRPANNVPVLGYEADFCWGRERFVIEVDGPHHRGRRRDRDNRRDLDLGRAGYLTRRVTENDLADPAELMEEVVAVLVERARA